jgi:hypothetical protein
MKVNDFSDEQILDALASLSTMRGGRSYRVCNALGLFRDADAGAMYRRLRKLECAGRVHRDPHYSAVNSIYWIVAGDNT